jgi:hypothetical protein
LTIPERPGVERFRFCQEGAGYDRNLWSEAAVLGSIGYIHLNHVRRQLGDRAVDWMWSSAARYLQENAPVDEDLPAISGLPPEFFTPSSSHRPDDWWTSHQCHPPQTLVFAYERIRRIYQSS